MSMEHYIFAGNSQNVQDRMTFTKHNSIYTERNSCCCLFYCKDKEGRVGQKSLSYAGKNNKRILYSQRQLMSSEHCNTPLWRLWAQLLSSLPMAPTSRVAMPPYFDHPEAEEKAIESVEQSSSPTAKWFLPTHLCKISQHRTEPSSY